MTSVIRHMHFHTLDENYNDPPNSHGDTLVQKIAGMLPRRSILRTLGLEYKGEVNEGTNDGNNSASGAISCLTRATCEFPRLIKRAYSPNSLLRSISPVRMSLKEPKVEKCAEPDTVKKVLPPQLPTSLSLPCESRVSKREYTCLKYITPVLERYGIKPSSTPSSAASSPTVTTKCPVGTTSPDKKKRQKVEKRSYLTVNKCYYQGRFDEEYLDELEYHHRHPGDSSQVIEVPSWRVNDILGNFYDELGPSKSLRPRYSLAYTPSISKTTTTPSSTSHRRKSFSASTPASSRHRKTSAVHGAEREDEEKIEETSDAVYLARHAKLELEEARRERLSHLRAKEDELRTRLEQRDADSWGKRQVSRVDPLSCVNPKKFMPKQLICPFDRARYIHMTNRIPVVAFGCPVRRPDFGPFSLR